MLDNNHDKAQHFMSKLLNAEHVRHDAQTQVLTKVVLIRLGIYVLVNKARGGGSPNFF
jgi:hypothetical protein